MTTWLTLAIWFFFTLCDLEIIASTTIGLLASRIRVSRALSVIILFLISGSITWIFASSVVFTSAMKLETNRSRSPVIRIVSFLAGIHGVLLNLVWWVETIGRVVPWVTTVSIFILWICPVHVFVTGTVSMVNALCYPPCSLGTLWYRRLCWTEGLHCQFGWDWSYFGWRVRDSSSFSVPWTNLALLLALMLTPLSWVLFSSIPSEKFGCLFLRQSSWGLSG